MIKPNFEPHINGDFRVVHLDPLFETSTEIVEKISSGELRGAGALTKLNDIISKYPYNFEAATLLSEIYNLSGDFEKACNIRYQAAQAIIDILPEDEEAPLDWEFKDNQLIGQILYGSAIDHFLISDFEMAAGFFETLLDIDPEDHLGATKPLAYCYIALGEEELLEDTLFDIDDKDSEKIILKLWASYSLKGEINPKLISEFKNNSALYEEFTSDTHEVTPRYIEDIDSDHPSRQAQSRLLWLQTEHIWNQNPGFIERLLLI